ncbi:Putative flippase GtrA (transmembrane translocase of bactoprenol-linked glucose) [Paramicrobacterium humi]|uniref:Putative flippase GtrA (Transmembrane translocase of bactoprenol-linked glucose) n=1 Tax=Paramicrobacterium humi TaxID=640635 RepID=A0A1H4NGX8_9MICO|nr:GtrA family protein [Microbacterium humi]SEB93812.1 Putative flippase GtrA (transmembrane translocase of bactoprenol-linked glucose) [Microbacterium humi]
MTEHSQFRRLVGLSTRFLTIGAISTLIEIAAFNVLFYGLHIDGVWSKIIASLIALVNAYFGNREWTFKNRGQHGRMIELVLFIAVNGVCTLLGAGIVAFGLWLFPAAGPLLVNVVNLFSIGIVVIARFLLYHFVVFRGVRPSRTAEIALPQSND